MTNLRDDEDLIRRVLGPDQTPDEIRAQQRWIDETGFEDFYEPQAGKPSYVIPLSIAAAVVSIATIGFWVAS